MTLSNYQYEKKLGDSSGARAPFIFLVTLDIFFHFLEGQALKRLFSVIFKSLQIDKKNLADFFLEKIFIARVLNRWQFATELNTYFIFASI